MGLITFKGTVSEYQSIHDWVRKQLGRPNHCENCETFELRRYHWANISGEYRRDIADWARLCVPCHSLIDGVTGRFYGTRTQYRNACKKGHPFTPDNIYIKPNGSRNCRKCQWAYHSEFTKRKRLKELQDGI